MAETTTLPTELPQCPVEDAALVRRCLEGDAASWQAVYNLCHGELVATVCGFLGPRSQDRELIEELTAQVWYCLVVDDAQLLSRYRADRNCRLSTYLAAVARNLVRNYLRRERRRRHRESSVATSRNPGQSSCDDAIDLVTAEFSGTLTTREQGFFHWCLESPSEECATFSGSENNDHQLRHRLRKKLHKFMQANG